jgi:ribose 5-phosphate isomerase B
MCTNQMLARYARQHNGANVLALGSTLVNRDEALAIVDTFIDTPMREARYIRRLAKIRDLELRARS